MAPPPFSSELVTAICSTALSVGKAGMSDWSRRDVPASGAGAWLPRSAGTAAPSTVWLQNEFSFPFFPDLVPDGLIPHFATSRARLGCCFSHQELRFIPWSYCWLGCGAGSVRVVSGELPRGKGFSHLRALALLEHSLLFLSPAGFA